jgi:hypothetical protein
MGKADKARAVVHADVGGELTLFKVSRELKLGNLAVY